MIALLEEEFHQVTLATHRPERFKILQVEDDAHTKFQAMLALSLVSPLRTSMARDTLPLPRTQQLALSSKELVKLPNRSSRHRQETLSFSTTPIDMPLSLILSVFNAIRTHTKHLFLKRTF